jgi:predicted HAD superfamily Cof-like phosphohydrolase
MNNYQRTAAWLAACGKEPSAKNLSIQIGCHIEELVELLECIEIDCRDDENTLNCVVDDLRMIANSLKKNNTLASIKQSKRADALDALCDCEVTGNGIAYLAGFRKVDADEAVLASNEAKLVDGKPVLLPGGKIGKPQGWTAPNLAGFV